MFNMGYEVPDYDAPHPEGPEEGKGKRPTKTVYPEVRLEAARSQDLPKLPEGEFYFIGVGQKTGYRAPVDEGAKSSCEFAIMSMEVVDTSAAKKLVGKTESDSPAESRAAFRASLRSAMHKY